jgi:Fe2+ or Zn2+ uptake regulation protein
MSADKRGIAEIACQIQHYLATHPNAADSVEGVLRWWLMRQHYEESATKVQQALDHLVEEGVIEKEMLSDGKAVYASRIHSLMSKH